MEIAILILLGIAIGSLVVYLLSKWQRHRRRRLYERAVAEFSPQTNLNEAFLAAANATGKPRGLRWVKCDLHGEPLFSTNAKTSETYAFVGAAIGFEAIPGGDMEEVEAVGDIRYATLVFTYRDGHWQTDGRAMFNLEPAQALERLLASRGR